MGVIYMDDSSAVVEKPLEITPINDQSINPSNAQLISQAASFSAHDFQYVTTHNHMHTSTA